MAKARMYEALVLIDVNIPEEKIEEIIKKLEEMVKTSEGGEILNLDRWGKKRLAYEINKKQFGYYVLIEFTALPSLPLEMNRFCRLENGVMRQQILLIPERVLKLRKREDKIRAALDQRRLKGEDDLDTVVEDFLEPLVIDLKDIDLDIDVSSEIFEEAPAEVIEEAPAEVIEEAPAETIDAEVKEEKEE